MHPTVRRAILPILAGSLLLGFSHLVSFWVDMFAVRYFEPSGQSHYVLSASVWVLSQVAVVASSYVLLSWSFDHVPGSSPLAKGLVFGLLLLFVAGEFRGSTALVYGAGWGYLVTEAHAWISILLLSVVLAWFVSRQRRSTALAA